MAKLVTFVRAVPGLSPEAFADHWRAIVLPALLAWPGVRERLVRATHHHAIPSGIRAGEGVAAGDWSGVGTYRFEDGAFVGELATNATFLALHGADIFQEVGALPVDEHWEYNRDPGLLPLKMFAFFKRKPHLGRAEAQQYYRTTHADVGESINRQRTVRYIQNHLRPAFRSPDPRFDFDAGPEIWFKSMEVALDLLNDTEAMRVLAEDEERFVVRGELINLLTDEQIVWQR